MNTTNSDNLGKVENVKQSESGMSKIAFAVAFVALCLSVAILGVMRIGW